MPSKNLNQPKGDVQNNLGKSEHRHDMRDKESDMNEQKNQKTTTARLAVIQVRGPRGIKQEVKDTLSMLRLRKKLACVVLKSTPEVMGMLKKAEDYITYGELDSATEDSLQKSKNKRKEFKTRTVYFMHPPRGGFERKGIKTPYTKGGVLGYRGEKINELITRMLI